MQEESQENPKLCLREDCGIDKPLTRLIKAENKQTFPKAG